MNLVFNKIHILARVWALLLNKHVVRESASMAEINGCPHFWIENPNVLIEHPAEFFPFSEESRVCSTVALNNLTRFGIYLGILLLLLTGLPLYLGIPVLTTVLAAALYFGMKNQGTLRGAPPSANIDKPSFKEGFANIEGSSAANKVVEDIIGFSGRTSPTKQNPFMNVLINEISEFPKRAPAKYAASAAVKETLDSRFTISAYSDPSDIWNRSQGQREFYTMPSTSIPNDRESYQNWLYRTPGKTCKEGNIKACVGATDGSPRVHLNSR